jgi:hypothetical protein
MEARVADILRIRLDGAESWDCRAYVSQKQLAGEAPWKLADGANPLCDRQIYRYIEQADALIQSSCLTSRKKLLRNHLAQRRSLFARAVQAGDVKAALAVLQDLARLQDLYPAAKVAAKIEGTLKETIRVVEQIEIFDGDNHPPPPPA